MAPLSGLTETRTNCIYNKMADFDPAKEAVNLSKHGISLARWIDLEVFAIVGDDRFDYGETRFQTYGLLDGRVVMVVWTPRNEARHVISMRHCHEREARKVGERLG